MAHGSLSHTVEVASDGTRREFFGEEANQVIARVEGGMRLADALLIVRYAHPRYWYEED